MNAFAVSIAVLLFPGLICAAIADKITVHSPRWGTFKYSIYSFVFGVCCYALLSALTWVLTLCDWFAVLAPTLASPLDVWTIVTPASLKVELPEIIGATAMAPIVSFAAAATINLKLISRIASKLGISRKFGDENLFSYYLNANAVLWVYVRDIENNLTYEGRVMSFSENDSIHEIALSNVKVYRYEDSEELYTVPTVCLSRPQGALVIEQVPDEYVENTDGEEAV